MRPAEEENERFLFPVSNPEACIIVIRLADNYIFIYKSPVRRKKR